MKPGIMQFIPDDTYYGIDKLIQYMLKNDYSVKKYEIEEYWLDIGRSDDFEKAQEIFESFEE